MPGPEAIGLRKFTSLTPDITSEQPLEEREFIRRLITFSGDYANTAIKGDLGQMAKMGGGREAVGPVPQRPDDTKIRLDDFADKLFKRKALDHGLKLLVITEDGRFLVGVDEEKEVEATVAVDPTDNSGEHQAGLDTPPYSAFTFFDKNLKPRVGGICDFLRERFLFFLEGQNRLFQYVNVGDEQGRITGWNIEEREIRQAPVKNITDPGFVLTAYMGSNLYSLPFMENGGLNLLRKMHPKGRFHGKGGSHAPLLLVTGADAYVMVDDIRTEVSPSYVMAKAGGFGVWVYDKNGNVTEYEFNPTIEDSKPRLHLLVMARNETVRNAIADIFFSGTPSPSGRV